MFGVTSSNVPCGESMVATMDAPSLVAVNVAVLLSALSATETSCDW